MGLTISILRDAGGDCTNRGLSAVNDRVCVVNVFGPSEPCDGTPAVWLLPGLTKTAGPRLVPCRKLLDGTFEPLDSNTEGFAGPMFGGNYASTSDSRWSRASAVLGTGGSAAVPVHDRVESWAAYEALSR